MELPCGPEMTYGDADKGGQEKITETVDYVEMGAKEPRDDRPSFVVRENPDFEKFYRKQNLVSSDSEFTDLMNSLRMDLPIVFRVIANTPHTPLLMEFISQQMEIMNTSTPNALKHLEWYPNRHVFTLNLSRSELRKSVANKKFHQFLVLQSEVGTIIRQEAVSMIPALYLEPCCRTADSKKPLLLDLCAAPGSKTSQLLEMTTPDGCVIANDLNSTRCHMLSSHLEAISAPNLMVTCHDASMFPRAFSDDGSQVFFDGILCDVPCSGDGTLRKAASSWRRWKFGGTLVLHKLQMKILKRALSLVKIGGRVVYSTCTLNPIENEAVVAGILRISAGATRLVSDKLVPCNEGLTSWFVADASGRFFSSFSEVPEDQKKPTICNSMFPPLESEQSIKSELLKCQRFLPHLNDTGGFFVAVFEKILSLPWENSYSDNKKAKRPVDKETESFCTEKENAEVISNLPEVEAAKKVDLEISEVGGFSSLVNEKHREQISDFKFVSEMSDENKDIINRSIFKRFGMNQRGREDCFVYRESVKNIPRKIWMCSPDVVRILKMRSGHALKCISAGCLFAEGRKSKLEGESNYDLNFDFRVTHGGIKQFLATSSLTGSIDMDACGVFQVTAAEALTLLGDGKTERQNFTPTTTGQTETETEGKMMETPVKEEAHGFRLRLDSLDESSALFKLLKTKPEKQTFNVNVMSETDPMLVSWMWIPLYRGIQHVDVLVDSSLRCSLIELLRTRFQS